MNWQRARQSSRRDYSLIALVGILLLLGVLVIYTISPVLNYGSFDEHNPNFFLYRHIANIGIGLVGFIVASRISTTTWRKLVPYLLGASIIAGIMLLIPATNQTYNGATRWIGFGFLNFQPAELFKLTAILYTSFLLAGRSRAELRDSKVTFWPMMAIILGLGFVLVVLQRDLGTMIVLTVILVGMMYFSGVPSRHLALAGVILAGTGLLAILMFPYRVQRLTSFFNNGQDLQGAGYHIDQALTAIGSGGLFGVGLGRSIQVYGFLPEAENDSVFAIHSEIFGFMGSVVVVVLFIWLLLRILRVAQLQTEKDSQLLVSGIFLWLMAHIIVNIGAMLALIPLAGLTLPFLSYGGSSLVLLLIALGIVFRYSGQTSHKINSSTSTSFRLPGKKIDRVVPLG